MYDLQESYERYERDKDISTLLRDVRVYAISKARSRKIPDAEEIGQDFTMKIYEAMPSFHGGNFRGWVCVWLRNYLSTYHYAAKRSESFSDDVTERLQSQGIRVISDGPGRDFSSLDEVIASIADLLQQGMTVIEIAASKGVSSRTIYRWIEAHLTRVSK